MREEPLQMQDLSADEDPLQEVEYTPNFGRIFSSTQPSSPKDTSLPTSTNNSATVGSRPLFSGNGSRRGRQNKNYSTSNSQPSLDANQPASFIPGLTIPLPSPQASQSPQDLSPQMNTTSNMNNLSRISQNRIPQNYQPTQENQPNHLLSHLLGNQPCAQQCNRDTMQTFVPIQAHHNSEFTTSNAPQQPYSTTQTYFPAHQDVSQQQMINNQFHQLHNSTQLTYQASHGQIIYSPQQFNNQQVQQQQQQQPILGYNSSQAYPHPSAVNNSNEAPRVSLAYIHNQSIPCYTSTTGPVRAHLAARLASNPNNYQRPPQTVTIIRPNAQVLHTNARCRANPPSVRNITSVTHLTYSRHQPRATEPNDHTPSPPSTATRLPILRRTNPIPGITPTNPNQPATDPNQPATNQQPTTTNQQPTATNQQPTATNQQPTATNQQPTATNQQPTATNQQPTTTNQQPIPIRSPVASTIIQTVQSAPTKVSSTTTPSAPPPRGDVEVQTSPQCKVETKNMACQVTEKRLARYLTGTDKPVSILKTPTIETKKVEVESVECQTDFPISEKVYVERASSPHIKCHSIVRTKFTPKRRKIYKSSDDESDEEMIEVC